MGDERTETKSSWISFKREEDKKAVLIAAVSAIVFIAGISGSGIFRWGKFDIDDASNLKSDVIRYMDKEFLRKEEYREKHAVMKGRMASVESNDEKLFMDIRALYTMVATVDAEHPPDKLKQAIEDNKIAIAELKLRTMAIEQESNWWHKMGRLKGQ